MQVSLVARVPGNGAGAEERFTMLETTRERALEYLLASGEAVEAGRRHACYFERLARDAQAVPGAFPNDAPMEVTGGNARTTSDARTPGCRAGKRACCPAVVRGAG